MEDNTTAIRIEWATSQPRRQKETVDENKLLCAEHPNDHQIIKDNWSDSFYQHQASSQIYHAIASRGRGAYKSEFDSDTPCLTERQLNARMAHTGSRVWIKNIPTADGTVVPDLVMPPLEEGVTPAQDFNKRHANCRRMILDIGHTKTGMVWKAKFEAGYPDFTYAGGRKVESVEDLIEAVISESWTNDMRGLVDFVQNGMWGAGNQWAVTLTFHIMEMLKLQYTNFNCDGTEPKKNHRGGSIKQMIVRMKQTGFVVPIRRVVKTYKKEVCMRRKQGITKEVKHVENATIATYGFNGLIGFCEGHPRLTELYEKSILADATNGFSKPRTEGPQLQLLVHSAAKKAGSAVAVVERLQSPAADRPVPRSLQATFEGLPMTQEETIGESQAVSPSSTTDEPNDESLESDDESEPAPVFLTKKKKTKTPAKKRSAPKTPAKKKGDRKKKDANLGTPTKRAILPSSETPRNSPRKKQKVVILGSQEDQPSALAVAKKAPIPCNHDDFGRFQQWGPGYFREEYLKKKKCIPRVCSGVCKLTFYSGGRDRNCEEFRKVTQKNPVYACPNAVDENHECRFALCHSDYLMHVITLGNQGASAISSASSRSRRREQRIVVEPGEKMDANGNIVASK